MLGQRGPFCSVFFAADLGFLTRFGLGFVGGGAVGVALTLGKGSSGLRKDNSSALPCWSLKQLELCAFCCVLLMMRPPSC